MKFTATKIGRSMAAIAFLLTATLLIVAIENYESDSKLPPAPDQLTDLERRIDQLEKVGPFEVVDSRGMPIFQVESNPQINPFYENKATLYSADGEPVAVMGADDATGYLRVRSADGERSAILDLGKPYGLRFEEMVESTRSDGSKKKDGVVRLEIGKREAGNYALNFFGTGKDQQIAAIGESRAGSGALVIGDANNSNRASMIVGNDDKGMIGISNRQGTAVLVFGEASGNTGGSLVIGSATGDPRVKMGTNDNKYGVVIALPQGLPYVPRTGLPGSYLLGCAGGGSCVH